MDEVQFWARADRSSTCWTWTGGLMHKRGHIDNYGILWYRGKRRGAHTVAYELAVGKIPKGMCVCHQCDNKQCINPAHLFLGTRKDNVRDAVRKNRNGWPGHCPVSQAS